MEDKIGAVTDAIVNSCHIAQVYGPVVLRTDHNIAYILSGSQKTSGFDEDLLPVLSDRACARFPVRLLDDRDNTGQGEAACG